MATFVKEGALYFLQDLLGSALSIAMNYRRAALVQTFNSFLAIYKNEWL